MNLTSELSVPLLDLRAQYHYLREEIQAAVLDVCESQQFVLGPHVTALENTIAEYSQARFAIGVSSGSDALLIALMALDIGSGDEVITSAFTFFATAGAIARTGATPVFCDIDPASFNLDPASVESFIKSRCNWSNGKLYNRKTGSQIKALIPVHLFGQLADMTRLMDLAGSYNLKVIEDAAQAIGAETDMGARAGSMGDIGCFSFFPSKNLGAYGDAGLCTTQDEQLANKLRSLRSHGSSPKYYHSLIGGNFRLDAMQAAILMVKFKYLDQWSLKRAANAVYYNASLTMHSDHLSVPVNVSGGRHVFNQYTLRSKNRSVLQEYLKKSGIGTEIYYPLPLHLQECFSHLGYKRGDCPHAEAAALSVLSIPVHPELTERQLDRVVYCISQYCQHTGISTDAVV